MYQDSFPSVHFAKVREKLVICLESTSNGSWDQCHSVLVFLAFALHMPLKTHAEERQNVLRYARYVADTLSDFDRVWKDLLSRWYKRDSSSALQTKLHGVQNIRPGS